VAAASAAVRIRLALALGAAALAAFACVASSQAAPATSSSYLAPASACPGADDTAAAAAAQSKAITCLVNWARRKGGRAPLTSPPLVVRAALLKGRVLASCKQLSHTPCGADLTAGIRDAGYSYGWFGENLFAGEWGQVSARTVVSAWLASPPHKANILRPGFRHLGAARVRVSGLFGDAPAAVWVATFASPR
jgi:uncharacterized protein YkwD